MVKNQTGFVYPENYFQYNFGKQHPLTPLRIDLSLSLMNAYDLFSSENIVKIKPRKATEKEVLKIHTKEYIDILKKINDMDFSNNYTTKYLKYGLGPGDNPIFPKIYDASLSNVSNSLTAADYLLKSDENLRSYNIIGGLHHALSDRASGFCILNDCAVVIQHISDMEKQKRKTSEKNPKPKVIYIDFDAHHGDGVQWIFYDRADVLTLSFHQFGSIFPGSGDVTEIGKGDGKGYSLNVPFPSGTTDEIYLQTYETILNQVMDAYKPDYVVAQTGVDTHFSDPLTSLGLSTTSQEKLFKILVKATEKYTTMNKLLVLGGGGYNIHVVARSWTMFLAHLAGVKIDEPLPESWLKELSEKWDEEEPPTKLRDRNFYVDQYLLKDPYFTDELEAKCDHIIDIFEKELIPNIK